MLPKTKAVPRRFFDRDPRIVGRDLLGKILVRRHGERILAGRIVETEAYLGTGDAAAHSAAGRTLRNAVLFGPPGHAYVYLIYGNHYCLNVSCLPDGDAGCVLLRALEPLTGVKEMARFRKVELPPEPLDERGWLGIPISTLKALTSGPGRLAQALAITRLRDNGKDVTSARESDLYIVDDGYTAEKIVEGPRIGITKAVSEPLRYAIAGSPFISGKKLG